MTINLEMERVAAEILRLFFGFLWISAEMSHTISQHAWRTKYLLFETVLTISATKFCQKQTWEIEVQVQVLCGL